LNGRGCGFVGRIDERVFSRIDAIGEEGKGNVCLLDLYTISNRGQRGKREGRVITD